MYQATEPIEDGNTNGGRTLPPRKPPPTPCVTSNDTLAEVQAKHGIDQPKQGEYDEICASRTAS